MPLGQLLRDRLEGGARASRPAPQGPDGRLRSCLAAGLSGTVLGGRCSDGWDGDRLLGRAFGRCGVGFHEELPGEAVRHDHQKDQKN